MWKMLLLALFSLTASLYATGPEMAETTEESSDVETEDDEDQDVIYVEEDEDEDEDSSDDDEDQ